MDITSPALVPTISVCVLAILIGVFMYKHKQIRSSNITPPQPKGALPIVGHLHLLPSHIPLFRTLHEMSEQIGPVFTIRLGTKPALVISSSEAVKECFGTNDRVFQTRPRSAAARYMGYDYAQFGLAPYGSYWREMRKFVTLHLLSNTRLDLLKHVRSSELGTCIKHLFSLSRSGEAKVDMSEWFSQSVMNNMTRMLAGKSYYNVVDANKDESRRFLRAIEEYFYLLGSIELSDMIPFTEWMDLQGRIKAMKRVAKELDYFMSSWLDDHVQSRHQEKINKDSDFIHVMLSVFEGEFDSSLLEYPAEDIIKSTVMNMILAGVDTTSEALTWALALLLNHSEILKRAQKELDLQVGRERWVEESDLKNLPYLEAIIKETLRLYPPGPLNVPRESLEDCYVAGYHIRKGTRLFVNIWKLHRDPQVWSDPDKFQPERFLETNAQFDVRGKHVEYIPFSIGRRACPGISFAMLTSSLTLARVLQGFDLRIPGNQKVDMSEGLGLSLPKALPLEVNLTPRLPFKLY